MSGPPDVAQAPVAVRVVRGIPTVQELAVLTVLLTATSSAAPATEQAAPSLWAARGRAPLAPAQGRGGWRASTMPG